MKIGFIGVGMMGEALLAGVLRGSVAPADVIVCERRADRAAELKTTYGVTIVDSIADVAEAPTIFLVVKPGDIAGVVHELAPRLTPDHLLISLAAGISIAAIEAESGAAGVIRVMPNTPALVGVGMAAMSPGSHVSARQIALAQELLAATGRVVEVPESQQDAVTAVSGSGPAYIFLVIEAMTDAGVQLGLGRDIAAELAIQTVLGAATMASETGEHPAVLRNRVTSPGGTTAAALAVLEEDGLRA
ncbi:MAG TPA: pyrroline-5-carboxylate reductase, partial [Marmoricola sp.]|nr:pyrroline-5-carboxylate reductase [Marmoricola sp.]